MSPMDFIKKQFVGIVQWTEEGDRGHGNPEWWPTRGARVANGGVRERRQTGQCFWSGHAPTYHADAAGTDVPEELGQIV